MARCVFLNAIFFSLLQAVKRINLININCTKIKLDTKGFCSDGFAEANWTGSIRLRIVNLSGLS